MAAAFPPLINGSSEPDVAIRPIATTAMSRIPIVLLLFADKVNIITALATGRTA